MTASASLDETLSEQQVRALEDLVEATLAGGGSRALQLLGYGEMTCVLAWQGFACKRLPAISARATVDAFQACFDEYVRVLSAKGVRVVQSRLFALEKADGSWRVYCVQPILAAETLLTRALASAELEGALALFEPVLDHLDACLDGRTGFDAQLSNWAVLDGELHYFDLTTPFIRDEQGRDKLDPEIFISALPALMRPWVRLFLRQSLLDRYHDHRLVVQDLLANLYNQGLGRLVAPFLARANLRLTRPLSEKEVRAYHRSETRTWTVLRGLLRLERAWQTRVRRKVYPTLLPFVIEQPPTEPTA